MLKASKACPYLIEAYEATVAATKPPVSSSPRVSCLSRLSRADAREAQSREAESRGLSRAQPALLALSERSESRGACPEWNRGAERPFAYLRATLSLSLDFRSGR